MSQHSSRLLAGLQRAAVASAFTLAIGITAPVLAQPAPAAPTAEQRTQARDLYGRGQREFDAQHFVDAQASFQGAYALVPNPVVLLGIASAQEQRGNRADARVTLERYLRERPDATDRAAIEARIAALPRGGHMFITPAIAPATPAVPATSAATPPTRVTAPATPAVPATTAVTVTVETREPAVTADVSAEEPSVDVAVEEEGAVAEAPPPADLASAPPSDAVWVLAATSAVTIVSGTVFGFLALSRQSDFDARPALSLADEGEAFALVADISFGVAVVSGIAAIVLFATRGPAHEEASTATSLRILPMASPQGGGLSLSGSF